MPPSPSPFHDKFSQNEDLEESHVPDRTFKDVNQKLIATFQPMFCTLPKLNLNGSLTEDREVCKITLLTDRDEISIPKSKYEKWIRQFCNPNGKSHTLVLSTCEHSSTFIGFANFCFDWSGHDVGQVGYMSPSPVWLNLIATRCSDLKNERLQNRIAPYKYSGTVLMGAIAKVAKTYKADRPKIDFIASTNDVPFSDRSPIIFYNKLYAVKTSSLEVDSLIDRSNLLFNLSERLETAETGNRFIFKKLNDLIRNKNYEEAVAVLEKEKGRALEYVKFLKLKNSLSEIEMIEALVGLGEANLNEESWITLGNNFISKFSAKTRNNTDLLRELAEGNTIKRKILIALIVKSLKQSFLGRNSGNFLEKTSTNEERLMHISFFQSQNPKYLNSDRRSYNEVVSVGDYILVPLFKSEENHIRDHLYRQYQSTFKNTKDFCIIKAKKNHQLSESSKFKIEEAIRDGKVLQIDFRGWKVSPFVSCLELSKDKNKDQIINYITDLVDSVFKDIKSTIYTSTLRRIVAHQLERCLMNSSYFSLKTKLYLSLKISQEDPKAITVRIFTNYVPANFLSPKKNIIPLEQSENMSSEIERIPNLYLINSSLEENSHYIQLQTF